MLLISCCNVCLPRKAYGTSFDFFLFINVQMSALARNMTSSFNLHVLLFYHVLFFIIFQASVCHFKSHHIRKDRAERTDLVYFEIINHNLGTYPCVYAIHVCFTFRD